MVDKVIKKIFEDSEKAEFLEAVSEELARARRVVICFESPHDDNPDMTHFIYYQVGCKMTYEILGYLSYMGDVVLEAGEKERGDERCGRDD